MSKRIYVPTRRVEDWRQLLADPVKHWRPGFSAQALAACWEAANGWPPEVAAILRSAQETALNDVDLLIAIPEYPVSLPPRGKPSQNDLFVLGQAADGHLVAITVEGKVSEPFGPTLAEWNALASPGKTTRLQFITRAWPARQSSTNDPLSTPAPGSLGLDISAAVQCPVRAAAYPLI